MSSTSRPTRLETKAAPALLDPPPSRAVSPPEPGSGVTAVDPDTGVVEAIVAVTGIRDEVDDVIEPGAFRRTLATRTPRMVLGHDWNRVIGRTLSAEELMPGDSRLPRTAPDGTPWPRGAGALLVTARFLLATHDGREAYEVAKAFGPEQNFSVGYKVTRARQEGGVRCILDLDVYEFSPVLHGANRLATLRSVKSAEPPREFKSTTSAVRAVQRRRLFTPVPCSICGKPAAATEPALPAGHKVICASCVAVLDGLAVDAGLITAEELAEADAIGDEPEMTVEEEYDATLAGEQVWWAEADGTLVPADDDSTTGRAWRRP